MRSCLVPGGQERGNLVGVRGCVMGGICFPCVDREVESRGMWWGGNCWERGGLKNPRHTVEQEDNLSI